MSMHLLRGVYDLPKKRKPKKKTKRQMEADKEHAAFLRRMGVTGKSRNTNKLPDYSVDTTGISPCSNNIVGVCTKPSSDIRASKNLKGYIVGQAYNKGGLTVLSEAEAKDPATGKRR